MPSFKFASATGSGSSLIVTCSDQFAGKTITCTNGTKTYTRTCPSTSPYEVVFKGIAPGTWIVSGVVEGSTYSSTITIDFETALTTIPEGSTAIPTDDIQTWLHCANIWDKNYTSISEILSDASTLQALIASTNAVDYMARSTTWASDVTANQSAMSYIGLNDYCSDALLSDSTWLNAICNSTYFESILNVKVPTMTSNTTPSGIAFASSNNDVTRTPYHAFDNVLSSSGEANVWHSGGGVPQFVGYKNTIANCVKYVKLHTSPKHVGPKISKLQGSNDSTNGTDGTWVDIGDFVDCPNKGAWYSKQYNSNDDDYLWYRLYVTKSNGNYTVIDELQFYGRA